MAEAPHAALADRFRAEPGRARVAITAATELREGLLCETTLRGHTVACDEPRSIGGSDSAQSPVELILTSLATCQAITYRIWAAELGIALDRVEVEAVGDIDLRGFIGVVDDADAGYERVRLRVTLTGPEPAERYAELAGAVDRHCPVLDAFTRPIPVERELIT
ncbi:MAG TPA: OsmC family protein [Miltoncostaeaceae bacterium]|jgi:uncharacterized OsmC-like protein|nr:OsmC family protein [Miltoncostaeaceae bacterium]